MADPITRTVEIVNKLGLHARAAAKLVNLATSFEANVDLEKDGQRVNGKSIMGVMMLAASKGVKLELEIEGRDEQQCRDTENNDDGNLQDRENYLRAAASPAAAGMHERQSKDEPGGQRLFHPF